MIRTMVSMAGAITLLVGVGGCDDSAKTPQPKLTHKPFGTITPGAGPSASGVVSDTTTVPPPAATAAPPASGSSLPDGEYACYGSGSTVLAGLGFKVSGGNYTDLDGRNPGTVTIRGTDVVFDGGIHDDQDGRDFTGKSFHLGKMVVCEKW